MRRLALAGFILFGSLFTPLWAQAQECEIDLTASLVALTQAQADAANGDTTSALSSISSVQSILDDIQQACAWESVNPQALTETFNAPDYLFSFQYPEDWFAGEFHNGVDWGRIIVENPNNLPLPPGGTVTVASEEITSEYSPYVALAGIQSVTVSVGTPLHLFTELGIYSPDFATTFLEGDFGFDALVEELEARIRQSPAAAELTVTPLEAERPTVAFEAGDENMNIVIVLVNLDEANNWYAMLVSPTLTADNADMLPLLLAMAESVE